MVTHKQEQDKQIDPKIIYTLTALCVLFSYIFASFIFIRSEIHASEVGMKDYHDKDIETRSKARDRERQDMKDWMEKIENKLDLALQK